MGMKDNNTIDIIEYCNVKRDSTYGDIMGISTYVVMYAD